MLPHVSSQTHWSINILTNFVTHLSLATIATSATTAPPLDLYKQSAEDNRHAWAHGECSSHSPASPLLQLKKMLFA